MIAEIAGLFGSRLAPRRSRMPARRRRPSDRVIALEPLEPRHLLAIDVAIVDNSGLSSADAEFYVTGHGLLNIGNAGKLSTNFKTIKFPDADVAVLDPTTPATGKFTQAAVAFDQVTVSGTTATVTTLAPNQLHNGDKVFISGEFLDQSLKDADGNPVATGVFTVSNVTQGTTWSVNGQYPFQDGGQYAPGSFQFTMTAAPSNPPAGALHIASAGNSVVAYLPKVITTNTIQAVSAANGVATITLPQGVEANLPVGTPISISGVTTNGLPITKPTPSTPFVGATVTQQGAGSALCKVTLAAGVAHGLVPNQPFSITTANGMFTNVQAVVNATGLTDGSLHGNEFTFSVVTAPTVGSDTIQTLTPTYFGAIQISAGNVVAFVTGTVPPANTPGLVIGSSNTGNFPSGLVLTAIAPPFGLPASGLPNNAVFLARASGPSLPTGGSSDPFIKGDGGNLDAQTQFSFNGNFAVLDTAASNPTLQRNQFTYKLDGASGTGSGGSASSVSITPVPVKSLPTKNGKPTITLDENAVNYSARMALMAMTPGPSSSNPFSTPSPLGFTGGTVDVKDATTPPIAVGTPGGNSVVDFMEFYYAGSSPSTIDLSAVDNLSLPLTVQASSVTTGPSTVGVNPNIGASREQIGNAFTAFIQKEKAQRPSVAQAGFDRLLYSGAVTRNLGQKNAPVPVAANATANLENVTLTSGTTQIQNVPTAFAFQTSSTVQQVSNAQGSQWNNVAAGMVVSGSGIPTGTWIKSVAAISGEGVTQIEFSHPVQNATGVEFFQQTAVWTAQKSGHGLVPGQSFTISGTGTALDGKQFTVVATSLTESTLANDKFTFTHTPGADPIFPAPATVATTNPGIIALSATQLAVRAGAAFAALPAKATNLEISGFSGSNNIFNNIYSVSDSDPVSKYGLPSNMVLLTLSSGQFTPGATATGGAGTQLSLPLFQAPPTVAKGQFFSLSAPKDWLSEQPALDPTVANSSVAINDPMVSYWDATLAKFFTKDNYLNIVTGNFVPTTGGTQLDITGVQAGDKPNTVKFTVASNGTMNALRLKKDDIVNVAVNASDKDFFDAYNNPGTRVLDADATSFTIAGTYDSSVPNPTSWAGIVANKMSLISYTGVSDGTGYNFTLDAGSAGDPNVPHTFFLPAPSPSDPAKPLPSGSSPSYQSLANALWVWGQGGIPSDVTGTVHDQIVMALCRGVANDGVFTSQPTTPGASNAVWTNIDNWYTSKDPANVYCPYSKFVHFGRLDGGTDTKGTTSIYAGGLAYGFSVDETPIAADGQLLATPLGGPSKMDGTVPDGATLTLTVNPWAQAAPSVTRLDKTQGSVNGGTVVTISGTGFNNTSTVKFGTFAATDVTYNPASGETPATLTVKSPAQAAGTVDITVTTGASTSPIVAADKFTYVATSKPIVHPSIAPLAADAVTFTILGEHFSPTKAGNRVSLSSGTAIVQSATATSITLLFVSAPQAGPLTATVTTGAASSGAVNVANVFATVTPATAILPATAQTLVITGFGFNAKTPANNIVTLSSGTGVVTRANPNKLTITLKTPPQPGPLTVTSISVNGVQSAPLVKVATVVPGAASGRSTLTTSAVTAAVGTSVAVTLRAIDIAGNPLTTGGAKVRLVASAAGTFSKVTDNRDGTYSATFTTPRIGTQVFSATVNGVKATATATTAFVFTSQFSQSMPGAGWLVPKGGFLPFLGTAFGTSVTNNVGIYSGTAATNVTVSAQVSNVQNGQFGGVVARYASPTAFYRAGLTVEGGQTFAVIQAVVGGRLQTLTKQAVAGSGQGSVAFTVNGTSLSLSLNGLGVARATNTQIRAGKVGVAGDQSVGLSNFSAG